MGISIELGPTGINPHLHQPRERFIFRHEHEPILVQLSEQILTVNVLAPYPGWNRMKPVVLKVWQRASRAIQAQSINRVGLRYINRLPRQSEGKKQRFGFGPTTRLAQQFFTLSLLSYLEISSASQN